MKQMPADLTVLSAVECEYITLPGWNESIADVREFSKLPANAQAYVLKVEELAGVPIQWVGVGAARDAMIKRF